MAKKTLDKDRENLDKKINKTVNQAVNHEYLAIKNAKKKKSKRR